MRVTFAMGLRPRRLVLAALLAWCVAGQAAAQAPPMDMPGPGEPATAAPPPAPAVPAEPAPPGAPATSVLPPGLYVALLGGTATYGRTTATATLPGILAPDVTDSQPVTFDTGVAGTLRVGVWGGGPVRFLGLATDLGLVHAESIEADSPKVKFHGVTFYLEPMLRLPLFTAVWAPDGVLNLYAGLALGGAGGDGSVYLSALGRPVSGSATGFGGGWLAGASVRLWSVLLLAEVRDTETSVAIDGFFEHAKLSFRSREVLLGIGWRI